MKLARFLIHALGIVLSIGGMGCAPDPHLAEDQRGSTGNAGQEGVTEIPLTSFCGATTFDPRASSLDVYADLVLFLNSLPRPLTLPCTLAALPRPLFLVGTDSIVSLQPAAGRLNPRIFLRSQNSRLVLSVALAGDGSTHLETAGAAEVGFSVKGDLEFPRADPIAERAFFTGIIEAPGTSCGFCHGGEHEARRVDGAPAYASRALKPLGSQVMRLTDVRALSDGCDTGDSGLRCQILRALFRAPFAVTDMQFLDGTMTLGQ